MLRAHSNTHGNGGVHGITVYYGNNSLCTCNYIYTVCILLLNYWLGKSSVVTCMVSGKL